MNDQHEEVSKVNEGKTHDVMFIITRFNAGYCERKDDTMMAYSV